MTIGLVDSTFLLVVNDDHESILHRYGDTGLQIFWGHEFDLLGSRDVIGHVTPKVKVSAWALSYWWSMMTMRLSCMGTEIRGFKHSGVTSLTFWGHMTSSVTWPLDSAYVVSCWWSIVTMRLSCTVTGIWCRKDIGVTTLTFWSHVTLSSTWPSDSAWTLSYWWSMMTMRLSCTYMEITRLQRFWGHEFDLFGSRDVIGHVTIRLGICGFLLVVHWNHASILHRYGVIKRQSCICPC